MIRKATRADAHGIARVHIDAWRTTYQGIVPERHLAALSMEERVPRWERILITAGPEGERVCVAVDPTGGVVGFASGGPERDGDPHYRGELYSMYILAAHQRRGIGRRLVAEVTDHILRTGFSTMLVWALAANAGMRGFCEALGGVLLEPSKVVEIGGATLPEVAYGWSDLLPLIAEERAR